MRSLALLLAITANAAAAKCPSLREASAAAGKPTDADTYLTPPLPVTWPPSGAAVRFYDLRLNSPSAPGESFSIGSPSVEITVPLDGSPVQRRQLIRANLGKYERVSRAIVEPWAFGELLQVLCENRMPNESEAVRIRDVYGAFFKEFPQLAAWLAANSNPFVAWVTAKPILLPPAPRGAKLTARIDGSSVVLTRDGEDVRFERAGLEGSQLSVIPLRADGTEPALWITSSTQGMLVRFADPPRVTYSLTYGGGRPGLFSTMKSAWLLDVDGDGFNDIVEYTQTHSDVGTQGEGPHVLRHDAALGTYAFDKTLTKKAPWAHVDQDQRPGKLISKALGVKQVELHGRLDLQSVVLPGAPPPQTIGGSASPPFVGPDVVFRVFVRKPGQQLGGHYHLAHVRYGKDPALVAVIDVGEVGFPANRCGEAQEVFRREGNEVRVVWPINNIDVVEQRFVFDGKTLLKSEKAPVKVADCTGM